jgi:hypothetical protein
MTVSNLIRGGGLAAALAGALFVIADLITLIIFAVGQGPVVQGGLLVRGTLSAGAVVLLLLGLVGLYAYRSEATGILGLTGFLVAFAGIVLGQSFAWAGLLGNLGFLLFGLAIVQVRAYPRVASILLIVGAVIGGVISIISLSGGPNNLVAYGRLGADVILSVAIGWLGFVVFTKRDVEVSGTSPR